MSKKIDEITRKIIELFSEFNKDSIPLEIIIERITQDYNNDDIEKAIEYAMDSFKIDKVLDYPSSEWHLYKGRHIWHITKLTSEASGTLHNLKPVDFALLKILKNQDIGKYPGRIKSDDARIILRKQGFKEEEIRSLWVNDFADHTYEFENGKSVEWCRLIPEDEKTAEYKRAEEEMHREFDRKESIRMYRADVNDLAYDILKAVRASPEGISKKDIIKQLFMDDPKYIADAFEIATEEDEILPITLEDDEDGYRLNPDFDKEDW